MAPADSASIPIEDRDHPLQGLNLDYITKRAYEGMMRYLSRQCMLYLIN